jgi:hypothetical protein
MPNPTKPLLSVIFNIGKKSISLDNKDLVRLYFIEDLFNFSMVGKLVFVDRVGLKELGPLTGDETITIVWGTNSYTEKEFKIYSIGQAKNTSASPNAGISTLSLLFCEDFFINLNFKKFSKSWQEKPITDIMKDIVEDMVEEKKWELWDTCREKLKIFNMPYWTPAQTIKWLLKRASSSRTNTSGYIMYSNRKGKYLTTLDYLLQTTKTDKNKYVLECSNEYYLNKILSWKQEGPEKSSYKNISGGVSGGYNPLKKELLDPQYQYSKMVQNVTALGKKTLFGNIDGVTNVDVTGDDDENIIINIQYDNFIKAYSLQNLLHIIVPGNHERLIGDMVQVQWPSSNFREIYAKQESGKYLIKSIVNHFAPASNPYFQQRLILMKNGYEDGSSYYVSSGKTSNIVGIDKETQVWNELVSRGSPILKKGV